MNSWARQLESNDRRRQVQAAHFAQYEDGAYDLLPLMIKKAKEIDVDHGPIDLVSSNFLGSAIQTSAKLIRRRGFNENDGFQQEVLDCIFELNFCSELNVAACSIYALGEWWIPPERVRDRIIELVHIDRRPDNTHPNTIRGIAFRMLARHDSDAAIQLIHTPAKQDFENAINYWLKEYREKYPDNDGTPNTIKSDVEWLSQNT